MPDPNPAARQGAKTGTKPGAKPAAKQVTESLAPVGGAPMETKRDVVIDETSQAIQPSSRPVLMPLLEAIDEAKAGQGDESASRITVDLFEGVPISFTWDLVGTNIALLTAGVVNDDGARDALVTCCATMTDKVTLINGINHLASSLKEGALVAAWRNLVPLLFPPKPGEADGASVDGGPGLGDDRSEPDRPSGQADSGDAESQGVTDTGGSAAP